jgi:hypothetical protein
MRQLCVVVLLATSCAVLPSAGYSEDLSIDSLIVNQSTQEVTVVLKKQVPDSTPLGDKTKWYVVVGLKGALPVIYYGPQIVSAVKYNGYVTLTLPADALKGTLTSLAVSFNFGALFPYAPTPPGKMFSAASSKTNSDNYISGTYSPTLNSAALYNIDAKGSLIYPWDLFGLFKSARWKPYVGGIATVSTDNRPTADPDSFLVSALAEWVLKNKRFWRERAQGVLLNWSLAGLEFDRQTTTKTFISSPIVEIPIRLSGAPHPGTHFVFGAFPYFGIGIGTNFSNALIPDGSGFVLRGVLGSSASVTEKTKWKYLSQIGVSANYTAFIPATNEIFTNTHYVSATGKTLSVPVMSSQVRNHVTDELDLTVAKPFSITIKHEYGELPPGFRTVDNKVTIGLTIMLQQNNTPQSNVNKNLAVP